MTDAVQWAKLVKSKTVSPEDQWEWDRAQNLIEKINASRAAGEYGDPTAEETATRRQNEQRAIQNYLLKKNLQSESVNDAVDAVDAEWVAANPRPITEVPPDPAAPE